MRPFFKKLLIMRALQQSRNQLANSEAILGAFVYLRLRAARMAQVSFVEFEVPNKP